MIRTTFLIIVFFSFAAMHAQETNLLTYSMKSVDSLMKKEARNVAVFLTADWCNFCKNMELNTLADRKVSQQLNDEFYFVKFNSESKETVQYQNQTFRYKPISRNSGTHELAVALGTIDGQLLYPTFVMLNPSNEIIFQHSGFLNKAELLSVLSSVE